MKDPDIIRSFILFENNVSKICLCQNFSLYLNMQNGKVVIIVNQKTFEDDNKELLTN